MSARRQSTLFFLLTVLLVCCLSAGGQQQYTIQDLGTVDANTTEVYANGINDNGAVVGFFRSFGAPTAFVWTQGTGIKPLDSGWSVANAINSKGQITGWYKADFQDYIVNHAARWGSDLALTDLQKTAHLDSGISEGRALNSSGQVAGTWNQVGDRPCFWITDTNALFSVFPFTDTSACEGINDSGQVVGWGQTANGPRAFRYSQKNGFEYLLADGYSASLAHCINNAGISAGELTGGKMALWDATGKMEIIGDGKPLAINDAGTVVGYSYASQHAFVWSRPGPPTDLNQVLANGLGWTLNYANSVNNKGQIVGYGEHNGKIRAFLLTPVNSNTLLPNSVFSVQDGSGKPVLGIVCDNLPGMVDNLDTLTIGLSSDYTGATITQAELSNTPDGSSTSDTHQHWNVGTIVTALPSSGALIYCPPDEENFEQRPSGMNEVSSSATRLVYLRMVFTKDGKTYVVDPKPIVLARPPIVLVHGINSSALGADGKIPCWQPMRDYFVNKGIHLPFVAVEHWDTAFRGNGPVELAVEKLKNAIDTTMYYIRNGQPLPFTPLNGIDFFKDYTNLDPSHPDWGLAVKRVDIGAWSYGGVITRWYITPKNADSDQSPSWYKRNYKVVIRPSPTYEGDIRKCITFGSMWRGVPLVNYLNEILFPPQGGLQFSAAPVNYSAFAVTNLGSVAHSLPIPTEVPSMEVMAVNSPWMAHLIYGDSFMLAQQPYAEPFNNNIAYGSVAGDNKRYPLPILGVPVRSDVYSSIDAIQQISWFPYLPLEQREDAFMRNYSDGLVPLWSAAIPGSYKISPTTHNEYPSDRDTQEYLGQWLNHAELPKGAKLNDIWRNPSPDPEDIVQTYDKSKVWTFDPILMAPYPQSELYRQSTDHIGRLNVQAISDKQPLLSLKVTGLIRRGSEIIVDFKVKNIGYSLMADVQVAPGLEIAPGIVNGTSLTTIRGVAPLGFLPYLRTIALTGLPGSEQSAQLHFPASVGTMGARATLAVAFSIGPTTNIWSFTVRGITLP